MPVKRCSGIAGGTGDLPRVFDDRVLLDFSASLSTKGYKVLDARARWLEALDQRLEIWTDFRCEDYPQEDFFGIGADTSADTRTTSTRSGRRS